ncbi:MAG: helix-turn-helix domain-containing protein [Gaiellaceae bacterium]
MFEIGSSLREARMRQSLDFNEMEARTKVRAKYLRALEAEQFDQLPAHTYVKGFLRTYADSLGMDGQLYVDEYNSRFVAGDDDQMLRTRRVPQARGRRERRESRIVFVALAAIAVLTALVIAAWRFGGTEEPKVQGVNSGARVAGTVGTKTVAGKVTVAVRAVRGASFMEVRVGSRAGEPLYRGTLERGQSKQFTRQKLYVSLAAPANVEVKVNGTGVRVPADGELTVPSRSAAGS